MGLIKMFKKRIAKLFMLFLLIGLLSVASVTAQGLDGDEFEELNVIGDLFLIIFVVALSLAALFFVIRGIFAVLGTSGPLGGIFGKVGK